MVRDMKIGIYNTNPIIHGGSTLAVTWAHSFRLAGHDVKIFTMSRSGKTLAPWRKDGAFEDVLASNNLVDSGEYLRQFDVVIPFGGFMRDEYSLHPYGVYEILQQARAIFMYHGSGIKPPPVIDESARRYMNWLYTLPNMIGIGIGGTVVQDSFNADEVIRNLVNKFEFYVMRHPSILPTEEPFLSPNRGLLSLSRFIPLKKPKKLFQFIEQHEELFQDFPLNVWGDAFVSRERYLVQQKYPDLFKTYYRGAYDRNTMPMVMGQGSHAIDLSSYVAGAQNTFFECLAYGVIPIVMDKWNLNNSAISMKVIDHDEILTAILTAKRMSDEERLDHVTRGWSYMKEHHDPKTNGEALGLHLKKLLVSHDQRCYTASAGE